MNTMEHVEHRRIMIGRTPLESLLAIVASVFDAYSALLFLPDAPEKTSASVHLRAFFSLSDNINDEAEIAPGQGLPGWVLRNQEPLLASLENEKTRLGYYRNAAEEHIRTFMGCPVPGGGLLCIDSKRKDAFTESRQKLLHLFALLIPQLLETGNLSPVAEETGYFHALSRLESLRAQGAAWPIILRTTLSLLVEYGKFELALLATLSEHDDFYTLEDEVPPATLREWIGKRSLEEGILGRSFREGKAFFIDPARQAPDRGGLFGEQADLPAFPSFICLPLLLDGRCCAVLCLANTSPRSFSNELCRFVRLTGEGLQMTLERISLKYRLNSLRKKLQEGRL